MCDLPKRASNVVCVCVCDVFCERGDERRSVRCEVYAFGREREGQGCVRCSMKRGEMGRVHSGIRVDSGRDERRCGVVAVCEREWRMTQVCDCVHFNQKGKQSSTS